MHDCVHNIIKGCAPILYALRIRAHDMNQPALQTVYQAVVMAKLLYAALACWGFTSTDWNRIAGFVQQSVQSGFCEAGLAEISMLVQGHSQT